MSQYQVQFVDDETFNNLPGNNMEEKVGVAYPNLGVAYARRTGVSALDAFTALHELEHLEGATHDEHYDSENHCYYKGFGDVLRTVAPIALSFLVPAIAPALGGGLSALGRGVQGIAGNFGLGNIFGQVGNAIGGAGNSVAGALGIGGGGGGSGAASSSANRSLLESSASPGNFASRARDASSIGSLPYSGIGVYGGLEEAGQLPAGSTAARYSSTISTKPNVIQTGRNSLANSFGGNVAQNAAGSLFGQPSGLEAFQLPSQGSSTPSISTPSGPNVIAGSSGEGSQGGPGGAPGSVGGGSVSKIKQYLANRDSGGNQGIGLGGNF